MATRKEKHARAVAAREAWLEEERQRGLKILEAARQKRAIEVRDEWRPRHEEKHFKFVDECPLCQDAKRELAKKEKSEVAKKAVGKVVKASVSK